MKKPMSFKAKSAFAALAAVVVVSGAGAAVSAQSNDSGSWQMNGNGQHGSGAMMQYEGKSHDMGKDDSSHKSMDYTSLTTKYRADVRELMNEAYQKVGREDGAGLYTFNAAAQKNGSKLDNDMKMAKDMWQQDMDKGMSKDEARNRYIDHFNNAKAQYFNSMDMARNQLSMDMDKAGHAEHKDWFINGYNHLRDMYGNQLEMIKNKPTDEK